MLRVSRLTLPAAALISLWALSCAEGEPSLVANASVDAGVPDGSAVQTPDATVAPPAPATDSGEAASSDAPHEAEGDADARASACTTAPCGLSPQCGCATTETCDLTAGGLACVAAGTAAAGAGCVSTSSCASGLVCVAGACRAPCAAEGTACLPASGGVCRAYATASGLDGGALDAGAPRLGCTVPCELTDQASCGYRDGDNVASGCVWFAPTGQTDCVRVASKLSSLCESDADCAPGRACVAFSGFSACRKLCKVGDPNACGECSSRFTPPRVIAGVTYGTCST